MPYACLAEFGLAVCKEVKNVFKNVYTDGTGQKSDQKSSCELKLENINKSRLHHWDLF